MADFPIKALFWKKNSGTNSVTCFLCPRHCVIADGKSGYCNVRMNTKGVFYSLVYGYPVVLQIDSIEKKPFAEFLPGTRTFSIGTIGCNLNCLFCQNYYLSRGNPSPENDVTRQFFSPESIVELSIKHNCSSIAYTYNEPTVWAEYAIDIAKLAKKNGISSVLVSNGYISRQAADVFYPLIDAANIDMKGFSEDFYSEMTGGRLQPVLDSIKHLYSLNKHVELTNLVIPGKNDDEKNIGLFLDWLEKNINKNIPLHFSAYHPMYKYKKSSRTSPETLYKIRNFANERGFNHVYLGNI